MLSSLFSSSVSPLVENAQNIYDFPVKDLRGRDFDLKSLEGKVVVIFNTASKCGFTPQLEGFQKLYDTYKDRGLVVLAFPSNEFGGQEPGTGEQIEEFCQLNYGVKFPVMEKIKVNGSDAHPLYEYLKKEKKGIMGLAMIKWNFEKFLVDRTGKVVSRYASTTTPEALAADIEKLL
ncbi:hypothetical protein HDV03_003577 [Kappamyces sp. JEL0829]|nr:hypothetical protein HDV03_003577 [Kappamyces sp. JEL0829]KAJ3345740.1 hypothetical protein HDU91_007252 [Kappamyces sp. JEL0680]